MKNLLLTAFTLLLSFNLFAQEEVKIGELKEGKNVITANISDIKTEWGKLIATQGNANTLDSWTIVTDKDKGNGETYHMLLAIAADKAVKVASILSFKDNAFFIKKVAHGRLTYATTTCAGCNEACSPLQENGAFICSDCPPGNSECTKNSSVTNVK